MKSKHLFGIVVIVALAFFIGIDYLKLKVVDANHNFTIGTVTGYHHYIKSVNNYIDYYYIVDGKRHNCKFRSNELTPNLMGQKVVVEFSNVFPSLNIPHYEQILVDTIQPPDKGWKTLPSLNLIFSIEFSKTERDSISKP